MTETSPIPTTDKFEQFRSLEKAPDTAQRTTITELLTPYFKDEQLTTLIDTLLLTDNIGYALSPKKAEAMMPAVNHAAAETIDELTNDERKRRKMKVSLMVTLSTLNQLVVANDSDFGEENFDDTRTTDVYNPAVAVMQKALAYVS